jgi:hypothetical protein
MAATLVPRETERRCFGGFDVEHRLVAGAALLHGTIGALAADGDVEAPGAGKRPLGRVHCENGRSAVAGDRCRVDQGCFKWLQTGTTITAAHIGMVVAAADNQTVTLSTSGGEAFGIVTAVDADGGVWVLSGFGVGTVLDYGT